MSIDRLFGYVRLDGLQIDWRIAVIEAVEQTSGLLFIQVINNGHLTTEPTNTKKSIQLFYVDSELLGVALYCRLTIVISIEGSAPQSDRNPLRSLGEVVVRSLEGHQNIAKGENVVGVAIRTALLIFDRKSVMTDVVIPLEADTALLRNRVGVGTHLDFNSKTGGCNDSTFLFQLCFLH